MPLNPLNPSEKAYVIHQLSLLCASAHANMTLGEHPKRAAALTRQIDKEGGVENLAHRVVNYPNKKGDRAFGQLKHLTHRLFVPVDQLFESARELVEARCDNPAEVENKFKQLEVAYQSLEQTLKREPRLHPDILAWMRAMVILANHIEPIPADVAVVLAEKELDRGRSR